MARGLARRRTDQVKVVGLDEKSFGCGQDYVSIMTDLKGARVLEVIPGNDTQSGCELWKTLRVSPARMCFSFGTLVLGTLGIGRRVSMACC